MRAWLLAMTALVGLSGCYGRTDDRKGGQLRLKPASFGLTGERPAVVVFSAAWCKPCRHEIPAFNELQERYDGKLDVVGALVEGQEKGSAPAASDIQGFADAAGVRPTYPLQADGGWTLFDSLSPQGGRTLPLTVFLTRDGEVYAQAQRSLALEGELVPMAESLLRGEVVPDVAPPSTQPQAPKARWTSVGDWVGAGHGADSASYHAVYAGWEAGLSAQGFAPGDMLFEKGSLKLLPAADGNETVSVGEWRSSTGCKLTVLFNADGSVAGTTGVCN